MAAERKRKVRIKLQTVIVTDFEVTKTGNDTIGRQVDDMILHYSEMGQKPNKLVIDLCPADVPEPEDLTAETID